MRRSTVRVRETAPPSHRPGRRRCGPILPAGKPRAIHEGARSRLQSPSGADAPAPVSTASPPPRSAWWVRLLSRLPFPALYAFAAFLGWLAYRVFPYRQHVVRPNLTKAFPEFDEAKLQQVMRDYYRNFAEVLVEIIKAASLSADEIRARVRMVNLEPAQELLAQGRSVLLVAAHQCNWEWMLLGLALQLGYRVDAAYKPLRNGWAEREMLAMRTKFGSRLVPAKGLLADI